jgi:type 1 glutamine amidotransferase
MYVVMYDLAAGHLTDPVSRGMTFAILDLRFAIEDVIRVVLSRFRPTANRKSKIANPTLFLLALLWPGVLDLAAAESPSKIPPLKVLFITGGGYHDYQGLAPHLTSNLSQRVNATFDVRFGLEVLRDPKFADGYDALVYDFCIDDGEPASIDNALNATRNGKPTVMIHCALHSFKTADEWRNCCGMVSRIHDPFQAFGTRKLDPHHPILKGFPDNWKTTGDELYQTVRMGGKSTPLLQVTSPHSGQDHIVCWISTYGKGRVFGTTLGHDMKTAAQADYLRLLANGLLWTCGKLDPNGAAVAGFGAIGGAAKK